MHGSIPTFSFRVNLESKLKLNKLWIGYSDPISVLNIIKITEFMGEQSNISAIKTCLAHALEHLTGPYRCIVYRRQEARQQHAWVYLQWICFRWFISYLIPNNVYFYCIHNAITFEVSTFCFILEVLLTVCLIGSSSVSCFPLWGVRSFL